MRSVRWETVVGLAVVAALVVVVAHRLVLPPVDMPDTSGATHHRSDTLLPDASPPRAPEAPGPADGAGAGTGGDTAADPPPHGPAVTVVSASPAFTAPAPAGRGPATPPRDLDDPAAARSIPPAVDTRTDPDEAQSSSWQRHGSDDEHRHRGDDSASRDDGRDDRRDCGDDSHRR